MDALNVLRAEYVHLIRPDRLQALADKLLDTQLLSAKSNRQDRWRFRPCLRRRGLIGRKLEAQGRPDVPRQSAGVTGADAKAR